MIKPMDDKSLVSIAMDFGNKVGAFCKKNRKGNSVIASQLERASLSVPSNISEGIGRELPGERLRFLRFAMGSLAEAITQMEMWMQQSKDWTMMHFISAAKDIEFQLKIKLGGERLDDRYLRMMTSWDGKTGEASAKFLSDGVSAKLPLEWTQRGDEETFEAVINLPCTEDAVFIKTEDGATSLVFKDSSIFHDISLLFSRLFAESGEWGKNKAPMKCPACNLIMLPSEKWVEDKRPPGSPAIYLSQTFLKAFRIRHDCKGEEKMF